MIRFVETQKVPLTREVAEDFATMPSWAGERDLEKWRCKWLEDKLNAGLFYSPSWCKAYYHGRAVRVDGQHSSHMLADADPFPVGLHAIILVYEIDTETELADLFNQFNQRESVRTLGQTINAHAKTEPSIAHIAPTWITKAVAGISHSLNEGRAARMSDTDRARLIHHNTGFIRWAHPFVVCRFMSGGSVVAAMYDTYTKNEDDATEFWNFVRDESHPDRDHPTRTLARLLRELYADRRAKRPAKWNARDVYIKCRHAWNAYRRGTRTDLKVYRDAAIPAII